METEGIGWSSGKVDKKKLRAHPMNFVCCFFLFLFFFCFSASMLVKNTWVAHPMSMLLDECVTLTFPWLDGICKRMECKIHWRSFNGWVYRYFQTLKNLNGPTFHHRCSHQTIMKHNEKLKRFSTVTMHSNIKSAINSETMSICCIR